MEIKAFVWPVLLHNHSQPGPLRLCLTMLSQSEGRLQPEFCCSEIMCAHRGKKVHPDISLLWKIFHYYDISLLLLLLSGKFPWCGRKPAPIFPDADQFLPHILHRMHEMGQPLLPSYLYIKVGSILTSGQDNSCMVKCLCNSFLVLYIAM